MKQFQKLLVFTILSHVVFPLYSDEITESELINHHSSERMLCTTITQGQYVRLNRCRNGEVMTGIQGFDPLTVYCTTIMANCRTQNLFQEQSQISKRN